MRHGKAALIGLNFIVPFIPAEISIVREAFQPWALLAIGYRF